MRKAFKPTTAALLIATLGFVCSAVAHIIPGSGTVDYTLTHESGYLDADGDMILRQETYPDMLPEGYQGGHPAFLGRADLRDDDSAGVSTAFGSTFFLNYSPHVAVPRVHFRSSVEQNNIDDTAVGAAILNLTYDASFDLDGNPWAAPIPLLMSVEGFVGDGQDAYIQFEARANYTLYDADGNTVEPDWGGQLPVASDGTETLGGSLPLNEADFLNGGGRITYAMNGNKSQVDRFLVSNYGDYFLRQDNPMALGMPWPSELQERSFSPPRLFIPPEARRMEVSGFFEFQAKNDGSPSGITVGGEATIPEPGTAVLQALLALLALRGRPGRRRRP
jgi:hypothetical protein